MFMVVRKKDARVRKISDNKKATNYIDQEITDKVSLAVLEAEDYDETETTKYNRIYYVFDGLLHLIINDKETLLQKGDAFFVERGMRYQMKGTFKAMSVNQPAFRVEL